MIFKESFTYLYIQVTSVIPKDTPQYYPFMNASRQASDRVISFFLSHTIPNILYLMLRCICGGCCRFVSFIPIISQLCNGCSFKFPGKVGVEESIVNAPLV
jgi:hypothetical protein